MWLLSTDRAELHHFPSPEAVTGGYAILSHTWGDYYEQTYQETQALRERCQNTGENPRDLSSDKVRECCILAERHGYRWVWNDTCCIDKTSSTELSEAINSMFVWYSCAEVCFAYLADVESGCDLHALDSSFRTSRWHSRGWTLQELIAPFLLIFVSRDWKTMGNKRELASLLEEITGVQQHVLTRETHYSVISVAERMLWASKRNTTRVEDEAYCLMGLFNVNMPTIYGEGRQAFQRLQHEIMKLSFDTSLFAWGSWINFDCTGTTPLDLQEIYHIQHPSLEQAFHLLAPSPKSFGKPFGRTVRYTPSVADPLQPYLDWQWKADTGKREPDSHGSRQSGGPFAQIELPSFSVTHFGVKCRFPIIQSGRLTIAVLLCDTGHEHIGLLLCPSNDPVQDPSRKKYHVGYAFQQVSSDHPTVFARLISLRNDFYNFNVTPDSDNTTITPEWRDIFIAASPPPIKKDVAPSLCFPLHSIMPAPPFRIPHWLIGRLNQAGLELQPLVMEDQPIAGQPLVVAAVFEDTLAMEGVCILLGTCMRSSHHVKHWAKVLSYHAANWIEEGSFSHDCVDHHIAAWPDWTRDFGDADRTVRLSFSRCKLTPKHTLVIHIELKGGAYDARKAQRNVTFPPREPIGIPLGLQTTDGANSVHTLSGSPSSEPANSLNSALATLGNTTVRPGRISRYFTATMRLARR